MKIIHATGALALSSLLAACGGGGGAAAPTSSSSIPPVVVSEASAKAIAAHGLSTAQDTSPTAGSRLVTGVQVQQGIGAAPPQGPMLVDSAIRTLLPRLVGLPVLARGVSINYSQPCALGGSLTLTGEVASSNGDLVAGDRLTLTATSCAESANGVTTVLSGRLDISVVSGRLGSSYPMHVVLAVQATDLSEQIGSVTSMGNGDARLTINASSATQLTTQAIGSAMRSRIVTGTHSLTTTIRDYNQTVTVSGSSMSSNLSAVVESDSPLLGSGLLRYSLSTPVDLTWNTASGAVGGGQVKVVGASNAQLLATFSPSGSVNLQLDLNSDGSFDKIVSTTVAELKGML